MVATMPFIKPLLNLPHELKFMIVCFGALNLTYCLFARYMYVFLFNIVNIQRNLPLLQCYALWKCLTLQCTEVHVDPLHMYVYVSPIYTLSQDILDSDFV